VLQADPHRTRGPSSCVGGAQGWVAVVLSTHRIIVVPEVHVAIVEVCQEPASNNRGRSAGQQRQECRSAGGPCFPPGNEAGGSLLPTNLPEPYCVLTGLLTRALLGAGQPPSHDPSAAPIASAKARTTAASTVSRGPCCPCRQLHVCNHRKHQADAKHLEA
jgi:hypothetical protein